MRFAVICGSTETAGRTSYICSLVFDHQATLEHHSLLCRFYKPKYFPYFTFANSLHALFSSSLHHHVANQVLFGIELRYQA